MNECGGPCFLNAARTETHFAGRPAWRQREERGWTGRDGRRFFFLPVERKKNGVVWPFFDARRRLAFSRLCFRFDRCAPRNLTLPHPAPLEPTLCRETRARELEWEAGVWSSHVYARAGPTPRPPAQASAGAVWPNVRLYPLFPPPKRRVGLVYATQQAGWEVRSVDEGAAASFCPHACVRHQSASSTKKPSRYAPLFARGTHYHVSRVEREGGRGSEARQPPPKARAEPFFGVEKDGKRRRRHRPAHHPLFPPPLPSPSPFIIHPSPSSSDLLHRPFFF